MKLSLESVCMVVCVCVVSVMSAPTKKENEESLKQYSSSSKSSIKEQEQQLEHLAHLAAQRLSNSIGVQKQQSFHYSNLNGKENSQSETEEKVVNPETGALVSDIQQKTQQNGDKPITETKVQIPSQNIDKSFVETDSADLKSSPSQNTDYSDALSYTPIDVAKYLYETGNFEELNDALRDLVNASIMTEKQAIQYKDDVKYAYKQLMASSQYADTNELPIYNNAYDKEVMPGYNYYNELLPYGGSDAQEVLPASGDSNGISDLVNTLMDEWLTRTVLTGDREAETMLSEIWDRVSADDNPDDLGQMREILVDIFTSEIIDGLTSDVNNDLPYYADLLTNGSQVKESEVESSQIAGDKQQETDDVNANDDKSIKEEDQESKAASVDKTEEDLKHLKM